MVVVAVVVDVPIKVLAVLAQPVRLDQYEAITPAQKTAVAFDPSTVDFTRPVHPANASDVPAAVFDAFELAHYLKRFSGADKTRRVWC